MKIGLFPFFVCTACQAVKFSVISLSGQPTSVVPFLCKFNSSRHSLLSNSWLWTETERQRNRETFAQPYCQLHLSISLILSVNGDQDHNQCSGIPPEFRKQKVLSRRKSNQQFSEPFELVWIEGQNESRFLRIPTIQACALLAVLLGIMKGYTFTFVLQPWC